MGVTETIGKFVLETETIPDEVRAIGTKHLVDGIAVMLSGATEESGAIVRAHLEEIGGKAQATVLGTSLRAPLQQAAWANGVAGHAMDYDDTQLATDPENVYGLLTHPTVPVLAAALAAAEHLDASGEDFLDAYIIGVETACRIADAILAASLQRRFPLHGDHGRFGGGGGGGTALWLRPRPDVEGLRTGSQHERRTS